MTSSGANTPFVAIACGGTGGHLFPGLAVAEQLQKRGCAVALLISPKDVDQEAVKSARGMEIVTLPAVGLQNRNYLSFAAQFLAIVARGAKDFQTPPAAGRARHGRIHQRAADPGREEIWRQNFSARIQHHSRTGQPLPGAVRGRGVRRFSRRRRPPARPQSDRDRHARPSAISTARSGAVPRRVRARTRSSRPILVMGGSQGASGINEMILSALTALEDRAATGNGCISPARGFCSRAIRL